ncbi:MAG: DUF3224 domain-containing protein [Saprospiraceae bacterium]|nr:DUF3224 domain-containing protein [Pyrinomonadaceae bacterium]
MKTTFVKKHGLTFCLLLCIGGNVHAQTKSAIKSANTKERSVSKIAKGTFEVKVTPQPAEENVGDSAIGRMSLDKQFNGDLIANSKGQMLGFQGAIEGSGGYVAMERVTGTLNGKKGSFVLQHWGTMQGGKFEMNVSVVPDSGTGDLKGISGKMKIIIEGAEHFYEFEYSLRTGQ